MKDKKPFSLPPYIMLMLVSVVMSFAIAGVYALTKDTIEAAALAAQAAARAAVMEEAADMAELPLAEEAAVDYCYEAYDENGEIIGYVSQITVVGFGGEIEVTVGLSTDGTITAISVGGSDFSETSGLGARTREPAFTDQFRGRSGMLVLKQNIDSVTGASISSGAVVSGVNKAVDYMSALLPEDPDAEVEELIIEFELLQQALPGAENVVWMGGGSGIDGWWQADNGYIVRATGFGEGPIAVLAGFDPAGVVQGLVIGDEFFMETEGRGDGVLADWYREQFIGRSGVQSYGDGLDAISGATVTSDATLAAINACLRFDPEEPGQAEPAAAEAVEAAEPDAVSEASIPEEQEPAGAASAEVSAEPTPEPDAVSEASVPEEEEEPAAPVEPTVAAASEEALPEPEPDAVSEASVPEEELPPQTQTVGG